MKCPAHPEDDVDPEAKNVFDQWDRCSICEHIPHGVGDYQDVVANCSQHDEGLFCGDCMDDHVSRTGCGIE